MLKKNKKNLMLLSGLAGALVVSSVAGVALSSCTTTTSSSSSDSSNSIQYSNIIDWTDPDIIKNLTVDGQGLVYSSKAMTEIIGVSPNIALSTITIPSSVTSISGYMNVVETNGVKSYVSTGAFEGITALTTIILPSDSKLESIGGYAFRNCTNLLTFKGTTNSLKFVGDYAFYGCSLLSNVNLSDAISIGQYAFYNCSSLTTAFDSTRTDKTGSLVSIGQYAFYNCSSLTDVNLNKVLSIPQYAFYNCSSLVNTYSVDPTIQSVGQYAFNGCSSLTTINLANTTTIGTYGFYNCKSLTSADLANVTSLGTYAFYGCATITTVNLAKITALAAYAFYGCTNLVTVSSPNLTNVNNNVFTNCTSLETIDLSKATRVYRYAFQNCSSLRDIGSLENMVSSGFYAFAGAFAEGADLTLKLTKAYDLSDNIFSGCKGIKKLDFTGNTTLVVIGQGSIANSSVEEIDLTGCTKFVRFDPGACQSATSLKTVYLPETGSNITIGSNAFNGDTSLVTVAPKAAEGETQKTGFVSTSSVTTIGAYAFQNTAITSIDLTNYKGYTSNNITTTGSVGSFQNIPYLASVNLGTSLTRLDTSNGKGLFYGSGLEGDGFDLVLPSNIVDINVSGSAGPFTNSGLKSIDMSKIHTYWNSGALQTQVFNYMFTNVPKLQRVILKPGTTAINANSFTQTPMLNTVIVPTEASEDVSKVTGFRGSSTLTSIGSGIFDSTQLETIDLTSMTNTNISAISGSFTNLPTTAVVKLPATATSLNNTSFTTTATTSSNVAYANIQYPSGVTLTSSITSGKLSGVDLLSRVSGSLDLTSNSTLTSIGENTFFGTSLGSLTLPAGNISSANLFSTAQAITTGTSKTDTPASYTKANVPFGNNASLTGLNYSGFTTTSGSVTNAATLFNTTNATTWAEVAKIINSLSNYTYTQANVTSSDVLPTNLSAWAVPASGVTGATTIHTDVAPTFTAASGNTAASVSLSNTYASTSASSTTAKSITSATTTETFIHNGITWTYKNDGTNITLTGEANMYKLSGTGNNAYLTFFNNEQATISGSTYNIPSQTKVSVTLTIATASSNAS